MMKRFLWAQTYGAIAIPCATTSFKFAHLASCESFLSIWCGFVSVLTLIAAGFFFGCWIYATEQGFHD